MSESTYDIDKTAAALGLTPSVVATIIKEMVPSVEEHLASMKKLLQKEEYEDLGKTAHKLKGMVANLRFEHMATVAKSVEDKGREGEREGYDSLLADLDTAFMDMKRTAESFQ